MVEQDDPARSRNSMPTFGRTTRAGRTRTTMRGATLRRSSLAALG